MNYMLIKTIVIYLTIGLLNALIGIVATAFMLKDKQRFLRLAKEYGYKNELITLDNLELLDEVYHTDALYVAQHLIKDVIFWPKFWIVFVKRRYERRLAQKQGS